MPLPSDEVRSLTRRRALFAALVMTTITTALSVMGYLLGRDGFDALDGLLLASFFATLPFGITGFWTAAIGFCLLSATRDPAVHCFPALAHDDAGRRPRSRTALIMTVHNEDPAQIFAHLQAIEASLEQTRNAAEVEIFLLSDTTDVEIAAEEERRFASWRRQSVAPLRLHYRRRTRNDGQKVGNIWEFLERRGRDFPFFIVLDADSLMSGAAITRLVRLMEANPRLGICQAMLVGLPLSSPFTRVLQFGMRHCMLAFNTGAAWWQGDVGPYWGHNAIVRTAAFMRHCRLPLLPGQPPLGGMVLSHDQIEGHLMRGAGYEVRLIVEENGSYEQSPPTLPDFIKRDLRWCQGNIQYLRLLGLPGLLPISRLLLALAISGYAQGVAWMVFVAAGVLKAAGFGAPHDDGGFAEAGFTSVDLALGISLFVVLMGMNLFPKIAGIAHTLIARDGRRRFGGGPRILVSALIELVFSILMGPVMALAQTIFIIGLAFGRTIRWRPQRRHMVTLPLSECLRGLWPQTLAGGLLLGILWIEAPSVLPWAAPLLAGLLLAVPFCWLSARPALDRWLVSTGFCRTPEETAPPLELQLAGYGHDLLLPKASERDQTLLPPAGGLAAGEAGSR